MLSDLLKGDVNANVNVDVKLDTTSTINLAIAFIVAGLAIVIANRVVQKLF